MLALIGKAKKYTCFDFVESAFLVDIEVTVPIFNKEGIYYRWAHKSIMEYFNAEFICNDVKEKQKEILMKFYESDSNSKYRNVLDLCFDIDSKTFKKVIIYKLVNDYINYCKKHYQPHNNYNVPTSLILNRLAFSFSGQNTIKIGKIVDANFSDDFFKGLVPELENEFADTTNLSFVSLTATTSGEIAHFKKYERFHVIIEILKSNNVDIFEEYKTINITNKLKYLPRDKFYIINDDVNHPLNSKECFETVNNLINDSRFGDRSRDKLLSLTKCEKMKEIIEREINDEISDEELLSNLL